MGLLLWLLLGLGYAWSVWSLARLGEHGDAPSSPAQSTASSGGLRILIGAEDHRRHATI